MPSKPIDAFPITSTEIQTTINQYIGRKDYGFEAPTEIKKQQMQNLLQALYDFDEIEEETARHAQIATIKQNLEIVGMEGIRFTADEKVIFFYPKAALVTGQTLQQQQQAQKEIMLDVGMCLWWRFGKLQKTNDPTTYKNPAVCLGITDEHEKKDGMGPFPVELFYKTFAKFMIVNAIHPRATSIPSAIQPSKPECDAAHSLTTMLYTAMKKLDELYPYFAVINLHGMGVKTNLPQGAAAMHMLVINNASAQFTAQHKSFPSLFAYAALKQNFIPHTLAFASQLPGFVNRDGTHLRLATNDPAKNVESFYYKPGFFLTTNVLAWLVHGTNIKPCYVDSGRSFLVELAPIFKNEYSGMRNMFIDAMNDTMQFWVRYVHDIHNVRTLNTREPEIFNDLSRYGELFTDTYLANLTTQPIIKSTDIITTPSIIEDEEELAGNNDIKAEEIDEKLPDAPITTPIVSNRNEIVESHEVEEKIITEEEKSDVNNVLQNSIAKESTPEENFPKPSPEISSFDSTLPESIARDIVTPETSTPHQTETRPDTPPPDITPACTSCCIPLMFSRSKATGIVSNPSKKLSKQFVLHM